MSSEITISTESLWDVVVGNDDELLPFSTFKRLATALGYPLSADGPSVASLTKRQFLASVTRLRHPPPSDSSKDHFLPSPLPKRTTAANDDFDLLLLLPEGSTTAAPEPPTAPLEAPASSASEAAAPPAAAAIAAPSTDDKQCKPTFFPSQKRPPSQPLHKQPPPPPPPKPPRHPPCICGDEVERRLPDTVRLRCRCVLHAACLGKYLSQLLGDAHTQVGPHGVRCPYYHTCKSHISTNDMVLFHDFLTQRGWDKKHGDLPSADPLLPLHDVAASVPVVPAPVPFDDEALSKLSQFSVAATFPSDDLVYCPACNVPFFVDDAFRKGATRRATCECGVTFCWRCLVPWERHRAYPSCEAYQRAANELDEDTARYVAASSKPCPGCSAPLTHYHGHSCHHISAAGDDAGGGCPRCHTHFCYACLATAAENERERGARQACRCAAGRWGTFCETAHIAEHLVAEPYPHDDRCGCPICPDCRPGAPCGGAVVLAGGGVSTGDSGCDGTCVVCLGLVPPGPSELRKPAAAVAADLLDYTSL